MRLLRPKQCIRIFFLLVGTMLAALLPVYGGLGVAFNTHQDSYAWAVSAAFKSGVSPAIVFVILWTLLLVAAFILMKKLFPFDKKKYEDEQRSVKLSQKVSKRMFTMLETLRMLLRLVVIMLLNGLFLVPNLLYVEAVKTASNEAKTAASVALGLIKLAWNQAFLPFLLRVPILGFSKDNLKNTKVTGFMFFPPFHLTSILTPIPTYTHMHTPSD